MSPDDDSPALALLRERLQAQEGSFRVVAAATGLELLPEPPPDGPRNRARGRVWHPDDRQLAICFYKPSQIPGSRTRYAYGVCRMPRATPDAAVLDSWLGYLASGLDPRQRPDRMLQAVPFEVPEDPVP
jgi:hypothetical protein